MLRLEASRPRLVGQSEGFMVSLQNKFFSLNETKKERKEKKKKNNKRKKERKKEKKTSWA